MAELLLRCTEVETDTLTFSSLDKETNTINVVSEDENYNLSHNLSISDTEDLIIFLQGQVSRFYGR